MLLGLLALSSLAAVSVSASVGEPVKLVEYEIVTTTAADDISRAVVASSYSGRLITLRRDAEVRLHDITLVSTDGDHIMFPILHPDAAKLKGLKKGDKVRFELSACPRGGDPQMDGSWLRIDHDVMNTSLQNQIWSMVYALSFIDHDQRWTVADIQPITTTKSISVLAVTMVTEKKVSGYQLVLQQGDEHRIITIRDSHADFSRIKEGEIKVGGEVQFAWMYADETMYGAETYLRFR